MQALDDFHFPQKPETFKSRNLGMTDQEIVEQLRRYNSGEDKPPWTGAVPEMSKLAARTQMDTHGLWWGWNPPEWFTQQSKPEDWFGWMAQRRCDLCIYEAGYYYLGVYYCRLHWALLV